MLLLLPGAVVTAAPPTSVAKDTVIQNDSNGLLAPASRRIADDTIYNHGDIIAAAEGDSTGTAMDDLLQEEIGPPDLSPPANDDICQAEFITDLPSATFYSNEGATVEIDEIHPGVGTNDEGCLSQDGWCSQDQVQTSVWFMFVAPETGYVDISIDQPFSDMQLALYKIGTDDVFSDLGDCIPTDLFSKLDKVAANDDSFDGVFPMIENALIGDNYNDIYYVQLDGYAGEVSTGYLLIDFISEDEIMAGPGNGDEETTANVPANDDLCNAQLIEELPSVTWYDNTWATSETNEIYPGDDPNGDCYSQNGWCLQDDVQTSIWFYFRSPSEGGTVDITTLEDEEVNQGGGSGDIQLALWKVFGDDQRITDIQDCSSWSSTEELWESLQLVAANEDYETGIFAPFLENVTLDSDQVYYIQLDGYMGDTSFGDLTIDYRPPPANDTDDQNVDDDNNDDICNAHELSIPSVTNYGCLNTPRVYGNDDDDDVVDDITFVGVDSVAGASWWPCANNHYHLIDSEDIHITVWFKFTVPFPSMDDDDGGDSSSSKNRVDILLIEDQVSGDDENTIQSFFKLNLWKLQGYQHGNTVVSGCSSSGGDSIDWWPSDFELIATNNRIGLNGYVSYIADIDLEYGQMYYLQLDGGSHRGPVEALSTGGKLEINFSATAAAIPPTSSSLSSSLDDSNEDQTTSDTTNGLVGPEHLDDSAAGVASCGLLVAALVSSVAGLLTLY